MTLTLVRTNDIIEERIDALIAAGTITLEDARDQTTILECARRYVETEAKKRQRAENRGTERAAVIRAQANDALRERMSSIVSEIAVTLRAEWTAELLDSTFAVGDGDTVTWRDATAKQHEARATMLEGLAAGNLNTAAIHRAAITDILALGVRTLAEVVG